MILTRMAAAIRRQDWFQVIIEILIVVIGIFLGLQVQEWYGAREERAQESVYLNRLHEEVMELSVELNESAEEASLINERLFTLTHFFAGEGDGYEFTPLDCHAITQSSIYFLPGVVLPTMLEIFSSGQISIIRNESLRNLFSNYAVSVQNSENLIQSFNSAKLNLAQEFPELLKLGPLPSSQYINPFGDNPVHTCDYLSMKQNPRFLNILQLNATRKSIFSNITIRHAALLGDLHTELDLTLGIFHEGEAD